jgi:hypothetical protein
VTTATTKKTSTRPGLAALFASTLAVAFFVPWVSWDSKSITGADMPMGRFFEVSETSFRLANPFPATNPVLYILWLVPAFAIIHALVRRKTLPLAIIAAVIGLCAATAYILFSNILRDLGVNYTLRFGIYITIIAAGGIILASSHGWLAKIVLLLVGPVLTWIGFYAASSYLENEVFEDTANSSAAYTVTATDLLREFQANDSLANAKYREKIITVNGNISTIEIPNDSTVNIKFSDSTGSYAIFPFHGEESKPVKGLKAGDPVSIKASCSGGILSEILGTESISFKRCTLNNK